jgi:predicted transcriptional regulator
MKEVLISIQPKWCALIASGKKTVEVRKTKPKLETPFKCYIYCTKSNGTLFKRNGNKFLGYSLQDVSGMVIGEFVCDTIHEFTKAFFDEQEPQDTDEIEFWLDQFLLSYNELQSYVGTKDFYGWHITDLVIYDKPMELSEFRKDVKDRCTFNEDGVCLGRNQNHVILCDHMDCCQKEIKRPPQSWCYVEEVTK